jgi:hypothetical protein
VTVLAIALVVLLIVALVIVPVVICVAKGKFVLAIVGVLVGPWLLTLIGAVRLAKPHSTWARRFYDDAKLERARARFTDEAITGDERNHEIIAAWAGQDIDPAELDRTTRRALRKAGRI